MRIAIVGSGIAGLTAAWLLNRNGHQVTLIERMPAVGLAVHGEQFSLNENSRNNIGPQVSVSDERQTLRADLPPRLFNQHLWPNLWHLYESIGIEIEAVEPTKSFGLWNGKTSLQMGRNWFRRPILARVLALLSRDGRSIAGGIRRLEVEASRNPQNDLPGDIDFDTYLRENDLLDGNKSSKQNRTAFINRFLLPSLSSTVCTCSHESVRRYPAATILEAVYKLIQGQQLFRVKAGMTEVARRLSESISDVRLNTSITNAVTTESGVRIDFDSGPPLDVDHLIVATQANSAIKFLPRLSNLEREMLASFEYEDSTIVLHRDPAFMPKSRRYWSLFNLLSDPHADDSMCTVWMNRFHTEWKTKQPVFQTIRPLGMPQAETIICQRRLQRPIVNQKSLAGIELLQQLHSEPDRRIWFAGSYAAAGVPLLESGVVSSQNIAEKLSMNPRS